MFDFISDNFNCNFVETEFATVMDSASNWRDKVGPYLAILCQKYCRGARARKETKAKLWVRYNHCAFIIQWAYRNWRKQCIMKALPLRAAYIANKTNKSGVLIKVRESVSSTSAVEDITHKIVRNRASYDEIMTVWRYVLELRRSFGHCSTDVLLKALIEAQCDINRAMVLVGNVEFVLRNDPDLPKHVRAQFLPIGKQVGSKEVQREPTSARSLRRNFSDVTSDSPNRVWSNTVEAVRSLRAYTDAPVRSSKDILLEGILQKSYYSVHHVGSTAGHKFYDQHVPKSSGSGATHSVDP